MAHSTSSEEERICPEMHPCLESCESCLSSIDLVVTPECNREESMDMQTNLSVTSDNTTSENKMAKSESNQSHLVTSSESVLQTVFSPSLNNLFRTFGIMIHEYEMRNGSSQRERDLESQSTQTDAGEKQSADTHHNTLPTVTNPCGTTLCCTTICEKEMVKEFDKKDRKYNDSSQGETNENENSRLLISTDGPNTSVIYVCETEKVQKPKEKEKTKESDCEVCLSKTVSKSRPCCDIKICEECFKRYISLRVQEAKVRIECPNDRCSVLINTDEVRCNLPIVIKEKFNKFLIDANSDPYQKTCPNCSSAQTVSPSELSQGEESLKNGLKVVCEHCGMTWCFLCQAPYHSGLTCSKYKDGDEMVRRWAKRRPYGQRNAQRCPKCKIFIQRNGGCNIMKCRRCKMQFCYRFGHSITSREHQKRCNGKRVPPLPQTPVLRTLGQCCYSACACVAYLLACILCAAIGGFVFGGWVLLLF